MIDSQGKDVSEPDYILDTLKVWLNSDRQDIFLHDFDHFYVDFTNTESIRLATQEIIDKFELECSIESVNYVLGTSTIKLKYNNQILELGIS